MNHLIKHIKYTTNIPVIFQLTQSSHMCTIIKKNVTKHRVSLQVLIGEGPQTLE
jgi:hypothetical protein